MPNHVYCLAFYLMCRFHSMTVFQGFPCKGLQCCSWWNGVSIACRIMYRIPIFSSSAHQPQGTLHEVNGTWWSRETTVTEVGALGVWLTPSRNFLVPLGPAKPLSHIPLPFQDELLLYISNSWFGESDRTQTMRKISDGDLLAVLDSVSQLMYDKHLGRGSFSWRIAPIGSAYEHIWGGGYFFG